MIRFFRYLRSSLFKANYKELLINSSLIIFFLFINFFALTNLLYSSRGMMSLNKLNHEIAFNTKELQKIKNDNKTMEIKIKNIVEFKDSDLVDQTIREYLGYAQEDDYIIKLGDIYEFWGRGLVLNQFDDQTTNYDNGTRGLYFEYNRGPLSFNHINGNSDIWHFGADLRIPAYNNDHSMYANQVKYDWNSLSIGVNQLKSNEKHQPQFGSARSDVHHKLNGVYGTWGISNADIFVEYVDKISTEKTYLTANDTLKRGHGVYGNLNLYLGNWGLSSEYKRYAFDKAHGDFTADDYGNQIEYQQMPTLGKEQNSTLLGRVSHNYNFNDERAVQFELNGSISGITLTSQYSHISRNENWQSVTTNEWVPLPLSDYLPSSNPSSLPYWENYQEITGYAFNDKIYFKDIKICIKYVIKTN